MTEDVWVRFEKAKQQYKEALATIVQCRKELISQGYVTKKGKLSKKKKVVEK